MRVMTRGEDRDDDDDDDDEDDNDESPREGYIIMCLFVYKDTERKRRP
jgi:hypothetical protein